MPLGYSGMKSTDTAIQCPFPMAAIYAISLLALMALFGCASTDVPAATDSVRHVDSSRSKQMSQVVIKFRDPTLDPAQQGYLNELSHDIGVTLVFVRPMSGGAYVLRVEEALDAEQFQRVVKALAKRAEVEYVEPDRRMHRMPHD